MSVRPPVKPPVRPISAPPSDARHPVTIPPSDARHTTPPTPLGLSASLGLGHGLCLDLDQGALETADVGSRQPRGLYRSGLPADGRQWSWSRGEPLEKFSLFLPAWLMAMAREIRAWRDIPLSAVIRRACEIGMIELRASIDREDAERAKGAPE